MKTALLITAMFLAVACSSSSDVNKDAGSGSVVGKWTLTSYNGHALPFTGSINANGSVNRVDSGSITFDSKRTYVLDIRIENTLGATKMPQDFAEVGSYSGNSTTGVVLKPNDLSGGTSNGNFAQVPVSVSGNTLSLPQEGKILLFSKQP
jgi:hypothetical protein